MDLSRRLLPSLWILAVAATVTRCAGANELGSTFAARDLVVHDADATLRDYCRRDEEGRLWLTLPQGMRFELVTSTSDPEIVNPGDGAFHPFEESEIRAALAQVRFPLREVAAEIFVLPYPRRGQLESAAGSGLILLAPGVRPLRREQQHAELIHELGHIVQYERMPDGDARWDEYRRIRSIQDAARFNSASVHADRPHEIFAEDFRALFGGSAATYSGTIENDTIPPPSQVAGLDGFLLSLAGAELARPFLVWPNPTSGTVRFSLQGGRPVPLEIFDAAGRRVATVRPELRWNSVEWSFDPESQHLSSPAVLYARPRGEAGAAARVVVLP